MALFSSFVGDVVKQGFYYVRTYIYSFDLGSVSENKEERRSPVGRAI